MRARVLLADDSAPIRRVAASALEGIDLQLDSARDIAEALEALEGGVPDLVLMDLNLPGGGARGFIERVGRRHPDLPVVVLMTPLDDFDAARGRRMGAAGVFIKPFDPLALRELVARHCPGAWEGAPPPPPPPDLGEVAMARIRREVLQVATDLRAEGGDPAAVVEREMRRLFEGERLDPRVEQLLREVIREELMRILPGVVREVVTQRIAQIEKEAARGGPRGR